MGGVRSVFRVFPERGRRCRAAMKMCLPPWFSSKNQVRAVNAYQARRLDRPLPGRRGRPKAGRSGRNAGSPVGRPGGSQSQIVEKKSRHDNAQGTSGPSRCVSAPRASADRVLESRPDRGRCDEHLPAERGRLGIRWQPYARKTMLPDAHQLPNGFHPRHASGDPCRGAANVRNAWHSVRRVHRLRGRVRLHGHVRIQLPRLRRSISTAYDVSATPGSVSALGGRIESFLGSRR